MMNDITAISQTTRPDANFTEGADQRRAQLEAARRRASAAQVESAQVASEQRAEQFRAANEIVSRAVGANTRLEISSGEGSNPFTYRAVDIDTGEVVSEWPPEQFANFIAQLGAQLNAQLGGQAQGSGIVVDEQA